LRAPSRSTPRAASAEATLTWRAPATKVLPVCFSCLILSASRSPAPPLPPAPRAAG
jgi:hypothetical protein